VVVLRKLWPRCASSSDPYTLVAMDREHAKCPRPRRYRLGLAFALGALTPLMPCSSFAQAGSADVSLARQLGNEGLQLAASGDCAGAVEKLKRAEGLFHAPTTLTVLAECHISLGKLVDGVEELTRVSREDLGRSPPPAFRKAQARARQKLEAARARLPKLRLTVEGVSPDASMEIRIDEQAVPAATLGLDRPVDPGEHEIDVTAVGYKPATAHVLMKEGAAQSLKLTLEAIPPPAPEPIEANNSTTPAPQPPPVSSSHVHTEERRNYVPGAWLLGVGAVGIGVGAVLGIVTLNKASVLSHACQPRSDCPASEQGEIDSAKGLALGSTIGFAVGAVGVGLGTYFLLKPPKQDDSASAAVSVRPWIGPGSAGLTGRF
jgi:hypothetical protein